MATNNMHNLTTLIKRLEAATLRLEDIASSTIELPQNVPQLQQTLASPLTSTTSPAALTLVPAPVPALVSPPEPIPKSIEEFDVFINQAVAKFAKISNALGGLIAEQAAMVFQGFQEQRNFLLISTKSKKPDLTGSDMSVYQGILKPINDALMAVNNIKDSNRGASEFAQLSTVSVGIMVLAWVTVDSRPYHHVEECLDSAQFFGNRLLNEYKDKDTQQVEWVQAFYQIFRDLAEYVKTYFPNGIPWNVQGRLASDVAKTITSSAAKTPTAPPAPASSARGPPPPPPPPGPPPVLQINVQKAPEPAPGGVFGAVFSDLKKGEAVTKGLRKVDRSEMTHKNPSLRASSKMSDRDPPLRAKSPVPGKKPKPESMRTKKPPKKELGGNKWTIENFEKECQPIEIEASLSHSILISKCTNTTIIIRGKANAVTIEDTNRLSLVVASLVSAIDVIKSANFALQVMGAVPTVMMDQVDSAQVYFSKESMTTKIFSSKSSGINLNIISGPDDDYKELPLPSQICSYYDEAKGDLVNEIVSHAS